MKLLSRIILAGSLSLATVGHGLAQNLPLEQAAQTNILRDIARELRTLNETLRRIECIERRRNFGHDTMQCPEGAGPIPKEPR